MTSAQMPVGRLLVSSKDADGPQYQPIYGGYANAKGLICLFAQELAYRINFKGRTIQQRPRLNSGAQARYDAAQPGEAFEYCGVSFRRLTIAEIVEICASGTFRMGVKTV